MHSFFTTSRRQRLFLVATLLFGLSAHARTASLSISGTAPGSAVAGQLYSFQPAVTGGYSQYARFYVANKPAWLGFNKYTGKLYGVPSDGNAGTYSNIVISAYLWQRKVSLPAFAITVTRGAPVAEPAPAPAPTPTPVPAPTPPANAAPTISGVPAISGSAGRLYSFTPNARDADGNTLTFSVQNKPSWATFNTATGALSGTPTAAGQFANIVIGVSDGTTSAALPAFNLTISPMILGSATVRWTAPATNIDGTPLANLAGFRVLYGTSPTQLSEKLELPAPALTSVEIADLVPGTYYFSVKAYTANALESDASQVVWKTIM